MYKACLGILIRIDSIPEIPATGHYASDYKYDASKHWKICTNENDGEVCGVKFDEETHKFSGNKCTVCGYTKPSHVRNSDRYNSGSGSSSGSTATSSTATSNGGATSWSKDASGRWWYYNGNTKVIGWAYDNAAHKWYYVDENKGMIYGWNYDTVDGYWYYLDKSTGEMLTGWQLINGKQYYFAPAPEAATYTFDAASSKWVYNNAANNRPYGSMYSNTVTPDNHQVNADGARVQ